MAWVREVGAINYSDDFERSVNLTAGSAFVLMGITAGILNARWGLWEVGDAVKGVCYASISLSLPLNLM